MSFARRLVVGTVLVLFSTVLVLVWAAERTLRRDLETELALALERDARLVREALPVDARRWPTVVRRLAIDNDIHIVLVDGTGRVIADSDHPPEPPLPPTLRLDDPALRAALAGEPGPHVQRSAPRDGRLSVTVAGGPGAIRVATSLEQMRALVRHAQTAIAGGALVALVLGSVLALIAGRSISQPLTALAASARAIAAGAPPRFPRSGIPDIDTLVQALRQMHSDLAERFAELRRERAETAALVEAMTDGVIAADGRGRITIANGAARRLLGYAADEPLPDLPELFRAKAVREIVDAALGGNAVLNREIDLDGAVVLVNARPLPSGGALLVLHDLTALRRLEVVRRDFVANVSHELKTPLTSISGYTETILTDQPDPEVTRRFLETILSNARRMQHLVDDLLDLSRLESGRWQPAIEAVDVAAVATEVWAALATRAAAGQPTFSLDIAPDATVVHADPNGLRQVLSNLLENSINHTPPGGRIVCRTRRQGAAVVVGVSDTGTGIASEHLPRIFERFYRADPSRSREKGGTGLGLAIVKHLVDTHGGRVWAESELGRGTTVSCLFPDVARS